MIKMTYGMMYNKKDLVLIPFPFTDLSGTKNRPALIIYRNSKTNDIITLAITSMLSNNTNAIYIDSTNLQTGFFPKKSHVLYSKIFIISEHQIIKKFGSLNDITYTKIISSLKKLF